MAGVVPSGGAARERRPRGSDRGPRGRVPSRSRVRGQGDAAGVAIGATPTSTPGATLAGRRYDAPMSDETPSATEPRPDHVPTLMTVHAHPDDETIGTGGTMALGGQGGPARRPRHVHPRRDGRDRRPRDGHARQPPAPGRDPGGRARAGDGPARRDRVGEPRLQGLGHDGPGREPRRAVLLAGGHRRGHRPARVPRPDLPARRHDDLQRLRRLRPPGPHPDAPRRGRRVRAGRRPGLVPGAARARSTAGPARPAARAGSRRGRRPSSTSRRSRRRSATRWRERMEAIGERSCWSPPEDATPEQIAEFEALRRPRCSSRTRRSRRGSTSRRVLDARWAAIKAHVTQISADNPFVRFGKDAWAEFWNREAYVRARVAGPGSRPRDRPVRGPRRTRRPARTAGAPRSALAAPRPASASAPARPGARPLRRGPAPVAPTPPPLPARHGHPFARRMQRESRPARGTLVSSQRARPWHADLALYARGESQAKSGSSELAHHSLHACMAYARGPRIRARAFTPANAWPGPRPGLFTP